MANVYHYFQRACQRELAPLRGLPGEKAVDSDGNSAIFWVETSGGRIVSVQYKCTTCFTLIALCEHLCEILPGMDLDAARLLTAADLLALHPEIPAMRYNRAELAIEGLRSALNRNLTLNGALV